MARALPLWLVLGLFLASAVAAPASAAPADDLRASAEQLEARTRALHGAVERYEAKAREKATADARLATLRRDFEAETNAKRRLALATQVRAAESELATIFAALIEYQKAVAKEAREDRRLQAQTRDLAQRAKGAALAARGRALDTATREAQERADAAMAQAASALVLGVVSSALATVSAATRDGDAGA